MKKRTIGRYLGLIIFLIMVILFPDDPAMKVAAATSLMVIWWITEAIPIPATALLPIVLFP